MNISQDMGALWQNTSILNTNIQFFSFITLVLLFIIFPGETKDKFAFSTALAGIMTIFGMFSGEVGITITIILTIVTILLNVKGE